MPRILIFLSLYSSRRATRSGNSRLHGPHHVAQKFINTTLSFEKSANETFFPVSSVQLKSATLVPSFFWTEFTFDTLAINSPDDGDADCADEFSSLFLAHPENIMNITNTPAKNVFEKWTYD